jgi:hypothetical protein
MTRTGCLLAALAATLAIAAPARAGTYDVVACGAPGAAGVNNSWAQQTSSFRPEIDPAPFYSFDTSCAGGLLVQSLPVDGTRAPWLTSGQWVFDAPAGTTLTKIVAWRYAEGRDDRAETASDDGDHWQPRLLDDAGNAVGGNLGPDACLHGAGVPLCSFGSQAGMAAGPVTHSVASKRLAYTVGCGGSITDGCQTSFGIPLGFIFLYGAVVTVSDTSNPSVAGSGGLAADGWRRPGETLDWAASDNVGVRRVRLLLDGTEVDRGDLTCDFTKRIPCPASTAGSLGLGSAAADVTDGTHKLTIVATDSAGNEARTEHAVALDAHAPSLGRARVSGSTVRIPFADGASGLASASIAFRDAPTAPWQPLSTAVDGKALKATNPAGSLRGKGIRVTATDNAGNAVAGQVTTLRFSARVSGRRGKAVRGGRVPVPFGRGVRVTGRLVTLDNQRVGGVTIGAAVRRHRSRASFSPLPAPVTAADGRFRIGLAKGVARVLRMAVVPGAADVLPRKTDLVIGVKAASTIRASRTRLFGRGTVRFSGRLKLAGARVPASGKIVELQGFEGGRWRTFATARARGAKARWHASNTFSGRPGTFPVRVRIRRESSFPFELGYSRAVRVRVG